jgi:hypothetical protein
VGEGMSRIRYFTDNDKKLLKDIVEKNSSRVEYLQKLKEYGIDAIDITEWYMQLVDEKKIDSVNSLKNLIKKGAYNGKIYTEADAEIIANSIMFMFYTIGFCGINPKRQVS